ncbi:hypothetical protein DID80_05600 [Candidatus Marinamargulisbacteria bacterium SCGC AAA071-K20]|nr:hypothetical protein DID80_05600 [Candidatus Marinamargulisbacteria bacterium SCGC AAA071-K20]
MLGFSINTLFASSVVAFLISLFLGSFVLFSKFRKKIHFIFFLLMISNCLGIFGDFFFYTQIVNFFPSINIMKAAYIGAVFGPSLLLHFTFILTSTKTRPLTICSLYTISGVLLALNLFSSQFFISSIVSNSQHSLITGEHFDYFVLYSIIGIIFSLLWSIYKYVKCSTKNKSKIKYNIFGIFFILVSASIYLPAMKYGIQLRFDNLSFAIYAAILSYAMVKKDLIDFKVIISKLLSYILAVIVILLSYLLLMPIELNQQIKIGLFCILSIVWAFKGEKFRVKIQKTAEKKFLKDQINYNEVLLKIVKELNQTIDIDEINTIITKNLKHELEVKEIQLLVPDKFSDKTISEMTYKNLSGTSILTKFPIESTVIKMLKEKLSIISINSNTEIIPELTLFSLLIPIQHKGSLMGILAMGSKLNEDCFEADDFLFFEAISMHLSSRLILSKPFEEIKESYKKSLAASEKLSEQAAFGTLAQGIAHEIYNPLGMLRAAGEALKGSNVDDKKRILLADMAIKNVDRLTNITRLMLSYGKLSLVKIDADVDINSVITDIVDLAQYHSNDKKTISITKTINSTHLIHADSQQLNGAILNLVVNAIQSIEAAGSIEVSTLNKEITTFKGDPSTGIEIRVKDTGCGIEEEKINMIFESFYSTKHENTGLGLANVLTIINRHNGTIKVDSKVGVGTTFIICLPI